jgi:hypothetical protein
MNVLEKSWLFEVVDRKTNLIQESFTLVLPPKAVTVKEGQRVSITKTFGEPHIDDYGADNIQLTIKAESGTANKLPTFKTSGVSGATSSFAASSQTYTGREAFQEFRDNIMRYRTKHKNKYDRYDLHVYDFEDESAYVCSLLDFSLERVASTPLRYPFTISLFVKKLMNAALRWNAADKILGQKYGIDDAIKAINTAIEAVDNVGSLLDKISVEAVFNADNPVLRALNALSSLNAAGQRFIGKTKQLGLQLDLIKSRAQSYVDDVQGIVQFPADLIKSAADLAFEIAVIPSEIVDSAVNSFNDTVEAYAEIVDHFKRIGNSISRAYIASFNIDSKKTEASVYPTDDGDPAPPTESQLLGNSTLLAGTSDLAFLTDTETSEIVKYNSETTVIVREGMTLENIANDVGLDDWVAMASHMGITNNDLYPGMELTVPIIIPESSIAQNESFILSEGGIEVYGRDLQVDDDGDLVVLESGLLGTIEGVENVKLAIDRRLKTGIGSLVKNTAYGLSITVGNAGTVMAIKYLKMAVESTILADPRISSVSNIDVYTEGDTFKVSCTLQLTALVTTEYVGSLI